MRTSKPITITLGSQQERLDALLETGEYESASEVMRAALRALERERAAFDEVLRRKVQEALDDPRPPIPAEEAFARVRAHAARMKADAKR